LATRWWWPIRIEVAAGVGEAGHAAVHRDGYAQWISPWRTQVREHQLDHFEVRDGSHLLPLDDVQPR
jgi:hypothetical protein